MSPQSLTKEKNFDQISLRRHKDKKDRETLLYKNSESIMVWGSIFLAKI